MKVKLMCLLMLIGIIVGIWGVANSSELDSEQHQPLVLTAIYNETPPKLEGNLSQWDNAPVVYLNSTAPEWIYAYRQWNPEPTNEPVISEEKLSGKLWFMWDEDYLYVAVKFRAAHRIPEDNYVIVHIDPMGRWTSGAMANQGTYTFYANGSCVYHDFLMNEWIGHEDEQFKDFVESAKWNVTEWEEGWIFEARVPLIRQMVPPAQDGTEIAIEIALISAIPESVTKLAYFGGSEHWENSSNWGKMVLVDDRQ